mmetsp:Transcript_14861/g.26220  ORF Transcript_14861/g.26220 Transcript_14861/m.26220 type:complete len:603 (-) Transcript_14861:223-2031(-)
MHLLLSSGSGLLRSRLLLRCLRNNTRGGKFLQFVEANAANKVAEALIGLPVFTPGKEHGFKHVFKVLQLEALLVSGGKTGLVAATPKPKLVRVGAISNETDLGQVRPRAAVGAAGHTHNERFVGEANRLEHVADADIDVRETTFGLRNGETAERHCRTGHGETVDRVPLVDILDSTLGKHGNDFLLPSGLDVTEDNALVRSQSNGDAELLDNGAEGFLSLPLNAAVLDIDTVVKVAIALLTPAHIVLVLPLGQGLELLELLTHILLNHRLELVDTPLVDEILEASLATVVAPSVVTLSSKDGLDGMEDVILVNIANMVGKTGESIIVTMSATKASTDGEVESLELALVVANYDNTEIVGVDINAIISGNGNSNLKLTRKELCTVERLRTVLEIGTEAIVSTVLSHLGILLLEGNEFLAVKPNVIISTRLRSKKVSNVVGIFHAVLIIGSVDKRRRCTHDVPVNITASTEGAAHILNNRGENGLKVMLKNAMKLIGLTGRKTKSAVAKLISKLIHSKVKSVSNKTGRLASSHHEHIRLSLTKRSFFTVVLLITTMEFHKLDGVFGNESIFVNKLLHQGMAKIVTLLFNNFDAATLRELRRRIF